MDLKKMCVGFLMVLFFSTATMSGAPVVYAQDDTYSETEVLETDVQVQAQFNDTRFRYNVLGTAEIPVGMSLLGGATQEIFLQIREILVSAGVMVQTDLLSMKMIIANIPTLISDDSFFSTISNLLPLVAPALPWILAAGAGFMAGYAIGYFIDTYANKRSSIFEDLVESILTLLSSSISTFISLSFDAISRLSNDVNMTASMQNIEIDDLYNLDGYAASDLDIIDYETGDRVMRFNIGRSTDAVSAANFYPIIYDTFSEEYFYATDLTLDMSHENGGWEWYQTSDRNYGSGYRQVNPFTIEDFDASKARDLASKGDYVGMLKEFASTSQFEVFFTKDMSFGKLAELNNQTRENHTTVQSLVGAKVKQALDAGLDFVSESLNPSHITGTYNGVPVQFSLDLTGFVNAITGVFISGATLLNVKFGVDKRIDATWAKDTFRIDGNDLVWDQHDGHIKDAFGDLINGLGHIVLTDAQMKETILHTDRAIDIELNDSLVERDKQKRYYYDLKDLILDEFNVGNGVTFDDVLSRIDPDSEYYVDYGASTYEGHTLQRHYVKSFDYLENRALDMLKNGNRKAMASSWYPNGVRLIIQGVNFMSKGRRNITFDPSSGKYNQYVRAIDYLEPIGYSVEIDDKIGDLDDVRYYNLTRSNFVLREPNSGLVVAGDGSYRNFYLVTSYPVHDNYGTLLK